MIDVILLSRFQFAASALFHFLFVPLTLGLSVMLAIMNTLYVVTGKEIYKDLTKFWGKLFGINFALGVTTGLTFFNFNSALLTDLITFIMLVIFLVPPLRFKRY